MKIDIKNNTPILTYSSDVMAVLGWTSFSADYKFGELYNLDSADPFLPVWDFIGSDGNNRKRKFIFSTTNDITHLVSSNNGDIGKVVTVFGLKLESDGRRTKVTQNVILSGQTPVALGIPLFRCTRLVNLRKLNGDFVGEIFAMVGNSVTGGIPDDLDTVRNFIGFDLDTPPRSKNQSQKVILSTASDKITLITVLIKSVLGESGPVSAGLIDIKFRQSIDGSPFRQIGTDGLSSDATSSGNVPFQIVRAAFPSTDLLIEAYSNLDNMAVAYQLNFWEIDATEHNVRGFLRDELIALGYDFKNQRYIQEGE